MKPKAWKASRLSKTRTRTRCGAELAINGAIEAEIAFLLDGERVELNAMTSDQLVAFVERKLIAAGARKVVPVKATLAEAYGAFTRVSLQPLWVDGPNAKAGSLVAENCDVIAQMLSGAGLATSGNVGELIPKLAGHEFAARLVISHDSRTGRTYNSIAAVIPEDAA